jgi:hypothetical protein
MKSGSNQLFCYKIHCSPAYHNTLSDILATDSLMCPPRNFMTRWKHPAQRVSQMEGIAELHCLPACTARGEGFEL